MEITYLQEFVDLANTCNYHESAENTFISAATLSKHIKKMEEELGGPLFDRSSRSVTLTSYGKVLLPYAKNIIETYNRGLQDFQAVLRLDNNLLNIGFLPMLGRFGVMDFLNDFTSSNPDISLNISEDNRLIESLLNHKYDFVFVDPHAPYNPSIKEIPIKTDNLVLLLPKEHPLSSNRSVSLQQLKNESFILQITPENKPTLTSQIFLANCQEAGFEANIAKTVRYLSTGIQFVQQGLGIGIMYSFEVPQPVPEGISVINISPDIKFTLSIAYLLTRKRNNSTNRFLNFLNEYLPTKGQDGVPD